MYQRLSEFGGHTKRTVCIANPSITNTTRWVADSQNKILCHPDNNTLSVLTVVGHVHPGSWIQTHGNWHPGGRFDTPWEKSKMTFTLSAPAGYLFLKEDFGLARTQLDSLMTTAQATTDATHSGIIQLTGNNVLLLTFSSTLTATGQPILPLPRVRTSPILVCTFIHVQPSSTLTMCPQTTLQSCLQNSSSQAILLAKTTTPNASWRWCAWLAKKQINALPVFDEAGRLVPPSRYDSALPGSIVHQEKPPFIIYILLYVN